MFDNDRPTIQDVDDALSELKKVKRPYGDNEGDSANSPGFYNNLSDEDKKIVDNAEEIVSEYVRDSNGNPNNRAIGLMNKRGYSTSLHVGQYSENEELVGSVSIQTDNDDGDENGDNEVSLNIGDRS